MFKTGDKIKIKSDIDKEEYTVSGLGWDDRMQEFFGQEIEVYTLATWCGMETVSVLDQDGIDWYFFQEDVDLVNDVSDMVFEGIVNSLMKD
jgi:hypothetical protein